MKKTAQENLKEIPGTYGLPFIGFIQQGLLFKNNWRGFLNERRDQYNSNVFRSNAGIKAITILDYQGIQALFDTDNIAKLFGFGPLKPLPVRIGNITPTVFTNGAIHARQKDFLLSLLRQRSQDLLSDFDRIATPYFQKWEQLDNNFDWGQELNALLSDFLFEWLVGAKPDIKDVENWSLNVLPRDLIKLPWKSTPVVESLNRLITLIQSGVHFKTITSLAESSALELDQQDIAKQILFYLGFNAWAALHGLTRSVIGELTLHPDWHQKARNEIQEVLQKDKELDLASLQKLTIVKAIIKETLRLHMPAPFAFGKARKDFVIHSSSGQFLVKEGEIVNGAISHAQRDPNVFSEPDVFDPSRFTNPEKTMDQYLIWANGQDIHTPSPTNRMCPGRDLVYLIMQLFLVKLLSNYSWDLTNSPQWNEKEFQSANRPDIHFECLSFERV